jgi:dihydroorotate dehydrogenase (fumarate)
MDLTTGYLGLKLKNPLVASASPLTSDLGNLRRLEDCGAAAVVLPSIFEEQIEAEAAEIERLTSFRGESFPEALSYFPATIGYSTGPQCYLENLRRAREAIAIPVIASLNGISRSGWCDYARLVEKAGANAIELNAYFVPSDLSLSGAEVENLYFDVVRSVKSAVSIPIAVKLSPYFSAPGRMAISLAGAGADGLVLFNRFYQPDIDLTALRLQRDIELSSPAEIRLPLLWIGALAGNVRASLAASSGVDSVEEVVKYLLVGADVVIG